VSETTDAVWAEGLKKHYKSVKALDGLDITVPRGTVMGLLGPNGAGKTTAVKILTTLVQPDAGTARVAGVDLMAEPSKVRSLIGVSGQNAAVDEYLTGFENLDMVGRLYHLGRAASQARARELLDQFDLTEAGDRQAKTYSGGMRRRLDLAGALVARPPVLFLDEPTTGLDPRSRTEMWGLLKGLVADGASVLLTTQYLDEADQLADNIVVIDRGNKIAEGTSDQLKAQVGGERIEVTVVDETRTEEAAKLLTPYAVGEPQIDYEAHVVRVPVSGGAKVLGEALRTLEAANIALDDVGLHRPTLDDVFMTLTGHSTDENQEDAA